MRVYVCHHANHYNFSSKINIVVSSWSTVVEGDSKAPFLTATTPRCRGGSYFFPWIAPLTFDLYLTMLSIKQGGIKYYFRVFGMTRPGIETRSPRPLANTRTIMPLVINYNVNSINKIHLDSQLNCQKWFPLSEFKKDNGIYIYI